MLRTITPEELQTILTLHVKWLNSESGGERANLYNANLYNANLYNANLYNANLQSANLQSANLQSANLQSADLRSADLYNANLRSADLYNANLRSADLYNAKYSETETLSAAFTIGPIGSRNDYLQIYQTDTQTHIKTGCFNGTLDEFQAAVTTTHPNGPHAAAYQAAIALIQTLTATDRQTAQEAKP